MPAHNSVLAYAAVLALAAPVALCCYQNGERAQGAPGYPAVKYKPCCNAGAVQKEKAGDWGKFCLVPGGGGSSGSPSCYATGERAQGAPGFPAVKYKPCCNAGEVQKEKAGDWGKFCISAGGNDGADIDPEGVVYEPILCKSKSECGCSKGYNQCSTCPDDQGSKNRYKDVCWCSDLKGLNSGVQECNPAKPNGPFQASSRNCYKTSERAQGAPGYPAVDWKPCCDQAAEQVKKEGDWGLFCTLPSQTTTPTPITGGTIAEGGECYFNNSGCASGLKCIGKLCYKGNCRYECSDRLKEGEWCATTYPVVQSEAEFKKHIGRAIPAQALELAGFQQRIERTGPAQAAVVCEEGTKCRYDGNRKYSKPGPYTLLGWSCIKS